MTWIIEIFRQPWAEAVGLALLHSLWQGTVIAAATALALRLLARAAPSWRYTVAGAALASLLLLTGATAIQLVAAGDLSRAGGPASLEAPAAAAPAASASSFGASLAAASTALRPALPWLVAGWLTGVLLLSLRISRACWQLPGLRRKGSEEATSEWQARLQALSSRLGLRRRVELRVSGRTANPATFGWLRPVVLVPARAFVDLSVRQLESLLGHELAHVRRFDYLANLLQSIAETLLFHHPAAHWLSARIREERENCCDDLAVAACGDARLYAGALADLEALRLLPRPALGLGADGGSLLARVKRLLVPQPVSHHTLPSSLGGGVLLLAVLGGWLAAAGGVQAGLLGEEPPITPEAAGVTAAEPALRSRLTCTPREKVRRCQDAAGEVRLECAPKSPMALFWQSVFGTGRQDDEVRVEVVRRAPAPATEQGTEPARAAGDRGGSASRQRTVKKKVVKGELPACRAEAAPAAGS